MKKQSRPVKAGGASGGDQQASWLGCWDGGKPGVLVGPRKCPNPEAVGGGEHVRDRTSDLRPEEEVESAGPRGERLTEKETGRGVRLFIEPGGF